MTLYSVVVYSFTNSEMTVIAYINHIESLARAEEIEALYQGKAISAYIDGYGKCEWL